MVSSGRICPTSSLNSERDLLPAAVPISIPALPAVLMENQKFISVSGSDFSFLFLLTILATEF